MLWICLFAPFLCVYIYCLCVMCIYRNVFTFPYQYSFNVLFSLWFTFSKLMEMYGGREAKAHERDIECRKNDVWRRLHFKTILPVFFNTVWFQFTGILYCTNVRVCTATGIRSCRIWHRSEVIFNLLSSFLCVPSHRKNVFEWEFREFYWKLPK